MVSFSKKKKKKEEIYHILIQIDQALAPRILHKVHNKEGIIIRNGMVYEVINHFFNKVFSFFGYAFP